MSAKRALAGSGSRHVLKEVSELRTRWATRAVMFVFLRNAYGLATANCGIQYGRRQSSVLHPFGFS